MKRKIVVLTGAGISAESGIQTFRGSGGLWEGYRIEDVASPDGWQKNPELVLDFYNRRREACRKAQPNRAHEILAELEELFEVVVITQNVDDLHERGGSSHVVHLHGELSKGRSSSGLKPAIVDLEGRHIRLGDLCPNQTQLRPFIVWFGEEVPMLDLAIQEAMTADIFLVVGTSLAVYPAAGLIRYTDAELKYIVDPNIPDSAQAYGFKGIEKIASEGMEELRTILTEI